MYITKLILTLPNNNYYDIIEKILINDNYKLETLSILNDVRDEKILCVIYKIETLRNISYKLRKKFINFENYPNDILKKINNNIKDKYYLYSKLKNKRYINMVVKYTSKVDPLLLW